MTARRIDREEEKAACQDRTLLNRTSQNDTHIFHICFLYQDKQPAHKYIYCRQKLLLLMREREREGGGGGNNCLCKKKYSYISNCVMNSFAKT